MTTSRIDTVLELARMRPLVTALAIVDAELFRPRFGDAAANCTIEELHRAFEDLPPFPGSRRVSAVLARATHLAETPLETVSRVRFEELGFPRPELPTSVWRPAAVRSPSSTSRGPCTESGVGPTATASTLATQGATETADPSPRSSARRRRENEVRAATRWACARWDWGEAWASGPPRDILLEAGLPRLH